MRKAFFLLICLFLGINVFAQEKSQIKNSFRVNSLALFSGFYEFQYERVINQKASIKFGIGSGTLRNRSGGDADDDFMDAFGTNAFNNNNEHVVKGFSLNVDYRYFLSKTNIAPKGLYVSPGIQFLSLNDKYSYTNSDNIPTTLVDYDYSLFNIRLLMGYQFIIKNLLVVNPYLGPGVGLGKVEDSMSQIDAFAKGFSLNFGLDIGVGF